jgi:hypothetical protein
MRLITKTTELYRQYYSNNVMARQDHLIKTLGPAHKIKSVLDLVLDPFESMVRESDLTGHLTGHTTEDRADNY